MWQTLLTWLIGLIAFVYAAWLIGRTLRSGLKAKSRKDACRNCPLANACTSCDELQKKQSRTPSATTKEAQH